MNMQRTIEFDVPGCTDSEKLYAVVNANCHRLGIVRPEIISITNHPVMVGWHHVVVIGYYTPRPRKFSHGMAISKKMKKLLEEKAK